MKTLFDNVKNGARKDIATSEYDLGNQAIASSSHDLSRDISRAWPLILAHTEAVSASVEQTIFANTIALDDASSLIAEWMSKRDFVRVLGAGRALLAGVFPINRMAHGGVIASAMGNILPMPAKIYGGGIVSVSASGKTKEVLQAMRDAKRNSDIKIIGLARHSAKKFADLTHIFIGIRKAGLISPFSVFADIEEQVALQVLDALVVMAGKKLGYTILSWKHEDLGSGGPYRESDVRRELKRKKMMR